jgi:hypothetical protein
MLRARSWALALLFLWLLTPAARAAPERAKAHVLDPRAGISVSVEVVYEEASPRSPSAPSSVEVSALPGDTGATLAPVLVDETTDSFAKTSSVERAPCLRRRFDGTWAFCRDAPQAPNPAAARGAPPPEVSPKAVARVLADRARALAPDPRIEVAPRRVGLTGLESYFWTDEPAPITAAAGVGGRTVTAQARAVQYVWAFGDGATTVASHPGRAWARSVAGDIAHMYEARGRYRLTLEQIWEARWRVGGGPWQSLGFFSNIGVRTYPVREVVPVLVPTG